MENFGKGTVISDESVQDIAEHCKELQEIKLVGGEKFTDEEIYEEAVTFGKYS